MDYRTLVIQLAALALVYVLLHNDCMAILKACTRGQSQGQSHKESHRVDDHITEDDKAIADAIFGSIAGPLFGQPLNPMTSPNSRKSTPSAHVEEVPDDKPETPQPAPTSDASLNTAGSAVRRRPSKRADIVADIDVPSA